MWQQEWIVYPQAEHTKLFYNGPCHNKARYVYKLARLELGRFVRIVTGHNNLNAFQTRIRLHNDPACRLCSLSPETFWHLVRQCPRLRLLQEDLFADDPPDSRGKWSVRKLLAFSYNPTINSALEGNGHDDTRRAGDLSVDSFGFSSGRSSSDASSLVSDED